jgi:hypothetical protein
MLLNGFITSDGGQINQCGFVYAIAALNADPLLGGAETTKLPASASAVGSFSVAATGLAAGMTYSYRSYASNSEGTIYSNPGTFIAITLTQAWRQTHFGSTANTGNAADAADPDRDGLPNLLEYALNLPPNAASRVPAALQAAGGNLEYTYTRGTAAYNGGTTFQVEWSDDLSTWSTTGVVESLISDDGTHQQVKATLPAGSAGRRFLRLRVQ